MTHDIPYDNTTHDPPSHFMTHSPIRWRDVTTTTAKSVRAVSTAVISSAATTALPRGIVTAFPGNWRDVMRCDVM